RTPRLPAAMLTVIRTNWSALHGRRATLSLGFRCTIIAICAALAGAILVVPAGAHGNPWGQTVTNAVSSVQTRFAGVVQVRCLGDGSSFHFVKDNPTWWNHLTCFGRTANGASFSFKYHALARFNWTVTNLRGASLADLHSTSSGPTGDGIGPTGGAG